MGVSLIAIPGGCNHSVAVQDTQVKAAQRPTPALVTLILVPDSNAARQFAAVRGDAKAPPPKPAVVLGLAAASERKPNGVSQEH